MYLRLVKKRIKNEKSPEKGIGNVFFYFVSVHSGCVKSREKVARAIVKNGKSYALIAASLRCCWAVAFYARSDVVVFSASMLDGKLSFFLERVSSVYKKCRLKYIFKAGISKSHRKK